MFNFKAYLAKLDSGSNYAIETLTGGLVNITVRATKTSSDNHGAFEGIPSMILKHAPPFVAALGPDAPFPAERQVVEAAALSLCQEAGALGWSKHSCSIQVRVPQVLHHDRNASVLIIEDLGPLVTLWEILTPAAFSALALSDDLIGRTGSDVGRRIGAFFARLHSDATLKRLLENPTASQVADIKENLLTRDVVLDAAVLPIRERLGTYPAAESLYDRVVVDYQREPVPGETLFSLGDCHPGAILLPTWSQMTADPSKLETSLAVIDWEFSTLAGRGVNGDMAQLLASLHCHLIFLSRLQTVLPNQTRSEAKDVNCALLATESFVHGLCVTYSDMSKFDLLNVPENRCMALLRSALILHGREIVNQASEREWQSTSGEDHGLIKSMVETGAKYIEMAGDNVEAMLQADNWTQFRERESHNIINRLFGFEV
ncbi:hypothetical protein BX600DRAFT_512939 [Xylariales sp. PMI_506]|nr:hypothetical protein BX600DRAFT_512939 [Xylariales sp. PMI_506]